MSQPFGKATLETLLIKWAGKSGGGQVWPLPRASKRGKIAPNACILASELFSDEQFFQLF